MVEAVFRCGLCLAGYWHIRKIQIETSPELFSLRTG
jgi:hypothetical protein